MRKTRKEPPYKRAGFATQNAYTKARRQAKTWAEEHSHTDASAYNPRMPAEKFRNYYRAYVSPTTSTMAVKKRGGHRSRWLEKYLVDDLKVMSREEFHSVYRELG